MADKMPEREPVDATRINLHEEWELTYWAELLGTTEAQLEDIVRAVGPDIEAVRQHLGKRQPER